MIRSSIAFVLVLAATACGGGGTPAKKPVQPMSSGNDFHSGCVETFQRQRECTDVFIPALVATRVRLDKPAGIAAKDAEIGRDALVANANEEWKTDSTDEAINATCDKIEASMPPQDPNSPTVDQARQCLASDSCQAFTDCILPVIEGHL